MLRRNPTEAKRRSKQFTGCWSCRRRGIKCDEIRPFCGKCRSSNIKCEGYQIRLCWENNVKSHMPRFDATRSLVLYPWNEKDLLNNLEVDYYLEKIDLSSSFILLKKVEMEQNSFAYGPFQVFKNDGPKAKVSTSEFFPEPIVVSVTRQDAVAPPPSSSRMLSPQNDDQTIIFSKLKFMGFSGVDDHLEVELLLIDYWIKSVTRFFVPTVDVKYNPYKMLSDLVFSGGDTYAIDVKKITLHSFCCISASLLSIPGKSSTLDEYYHDVMFESYWKYHKSKTFDLIASLYSSKEAFSFDELCMLIASMLLLLTIDVIHPTDQWQVHLKGLLSVFKTAINRMENDQLDNSNNYYNTDLFEILAFFGQMTKISYIFGTLAQENPHSIYKVSITDFAFLKFPNSEDKTPLLFKNHGITEDMLECLTDIVEYLQFPNDGNKSVIITDISNKILDTSPVPLTVEASEDLDSRIRYHQSSIFHIALTLYFSREVSGIKPAELQDLVNIGIDHIEQCLRLLRDLGSTGLLWPYFVICCESTTTNGQSRLESWFELVSLHQVSSIDCSIRIIKEVWKRRVLDDSVSWIAVKQEMNPGLLLN